MITIGIMLAVLPIIKAEASAFLNAIKDIEKHKSATQIEHTIQQLKSLAQSERSWDEPVFKGTFKNFPITSFVFDDTPMTGIEFSLSQKIPLSDHKSAKSHSILSNSLVLEWKKKDTIRKLRLSAWKQAILWLQKKREIRTIKESTDWIKKKIEVTQSFYINGKASQQALLELKVRHSQIKQLIKRKEYEQKKVLEGLKYILGEHFQIQENEIPIEYLSKHNNAGKHAEEESLKAKVKAKYSEINLKNLRKTPDITVGAGYTLRSSLDDKGDFLSLFIQVPLPINSKRQDNYEAAKAAQLSSQLAYDDFKIKRKTKISQAILDIERIEVEKSILTNKTIKFSEASRDVISGSYGIGNASYEELLSAELSLQSLRLQEIQLWSELHITKAELKYLKGEQLW